MALFSFFRFSWRFMTFHGGSKSFYDNAAVGLKNYSYLDLRFALRQVYYSKVSFLHCKYRREEKSK